MTVASIGRNDIVGEIAILCDVPRTATVLATTPLVALRVSKDGFFNLVTQFPAGRRRGHARAGRRGCTRPRTRLTETSLRLRELERMATEPSPPPDTTGQLAARAELGPGLAGARHRLATRSSTTCSASLCQRLRQDGTAADARHHAPAHAAPAVPGCARPVAVDLPEPELTCWSTASSTIRGSSTARSGPSTRAPTAFASGSTCRAASRPTSSASTPICVPRATPTTSPCRCSSPTASGTPPAGAPTSPAGSRPRDLIVINELLPVLRDGGRDPGQPPDHQEPAQHLCRPACRRAHPVGRHPRGSGHTIQAAIWNCDLRGFTRDRRAVAARRRHRPGSTTISTSWRRRSRSMAARC